MEFKNIREECLQANIELVKLGLVDMTFGNVSVYSADQKVFAIKPSGVDYGSMSVEDMVVVDMAGAVVSGKLGPSSDTATHRCLYAAFAEAGVRSIAHTHSRHAVAFAQAAREVPCLGTTHSDFFNGAVPVTRVMTVAEVQGDYEWETGNVIVESFAETDPMEVPAVLVNCHGPFAWGESGAKAVEHAHALEIVAQMAMHTFSINPDAVGTTPHLLNKHFCRKHGDTAYYGQKNGSKHEA